MKPIVLQLLPVLVFIVVDAFVTDVRISIACAVAFAFAQLVFTWVRSRRLEWLVLLDVGLIAALGSVSIAFEDELLFKLKPAIMEAITVAFVLGLLLAPQRLLVAYLARVTPGGAPGPELLGAMKSLLRWMCGCTALHIGAVVYSALACSKPVWAMVSGPGFYVALLPVLAVVLVERFRKKPLEAHRPP